MKFNDEPIDSSLKALLSINLKFQSINKTLESKYGLSVVQWSLLKTLLDMPAVSHLVLARALEITPGTLTQTLTRLQKKELVFICDDAKDARKKVISITRKGRDKLFDISDVYESTFLGIAKVSTELSKIKNLLEEKVKFRLSESGIDFSESGGITGRNS